MKGRRPVAMFLLTAVLTAGVLLPGSAAAQDDPVAQCAEGVRLFVNGRAAEAGSLLEAGYAGRSTAEFADPNDLGLCALALGILRGNTGNPTRALEAYAVALETFRVSGNRQLEAATLHNIGAAYYNQGRYAEALATYEQALAIVREVGDRADLAAPLNNMGAVYRSQGRYSEALEAFGQALAIARELGDRTGEGTQLSNIGAVYDGQGRYAEALVTNEQALAIRREVGDRAGEAATLNNIGKGYQSQGRYAEALASYEQALAILLELGNRAGEGTTLSNIGVVYAYQGRYAEALEAFEHALAIAREMGDRAGEGRALNNIGSVYSSRGRYADALEVDQLTLAIAREMRDRAGEAGTLNNIGEVYRSQGRYAEALEAFEHALAIAREVGNRAGEGATLNNIGVVYSSQGRYAEALATYEQALAILREVGDPAGEAATLNNVGGVHLSQGRYAEALATYEQALAILLELGNRAGESVTLNNIGEVHSSQGRYIEALEYYQQALAIVREVGSRADEGATLNSIGYAYQQQGEAARAIETYEQAMGVLESLRSVAGSEAGRAAFISQHAALYDSAVALYHKQDQDVQAFFTSERGRCRAFLDSLFTGYVELSDYQAAGLLTREQETYVARQGTQDALARARGTLPTDPALEADLEAQLAEAEKEHAAALAAIQERGDQLAALVPGRSAVLSLTDVQGLLEPDTTLVAYHVLGAEGSLAFVITANGMQVLELPEATPQHLRAAVAGLTAWASLENPHPLPLQNLYRWLIAPLADQLKTRRVALVPNSVLHYVPFAGLTDGEHYLGERYELSVLPSASSLRFIQQNAAEPDGDGVLVFGSPASDEPGLKPLAYAEQEAADVAGLLGAPAALGADATEMRLRSGAAGTKVLHLSAHGGYNSVNPLYSAIYLAPGDGQDGRLETHEVYSLDLKGNEVVVLSACDTNVGELSAGDEVVGLTRAFFFAGAPTVIASLWAVDDAATGVLMSAFYRHWLQDGMSKAGALQAAQADVRRDSRWGSPFYWAGFVLNGDPREARQSVPSPSPQTNDLEDSGSTSRSGPMFLALAYVGAVLAGGLVLWLTTRRRVQ